MYNDLKGKTAIITGSGKKTGIGFGIAKKLAASGTNIIVADLGINAEAEKEMSEVVKELTADYKIETFSVKVDVVDNSSIENMINSVKEKTGHIDILCNNAGASFGVPSVVHNYDEELWMKTIDVNLHGVFKMSRAVLPLMFGKAGSIINTSSRASKVPGIMNGAYAVAKAGVNMLTKVMAKELGGIGIRINAVCPGQINTDLEKWRFGLEAKIFNTTVEEREKEMCKTIPLGRIGNIDEVGALVAFLASEESSYITGQALNISGGQLMEY